jgi:3'-phosphoadenosine 5'-phosphosulfate sulfotransferase (PAPS reductase)/FAD synthetase
LAWLNQHDEWFSPQDPELLSFMGAMCGVIVDEENVPNWLVVEEDGTLGCKVCTCPVITIAQHEHENDHFQAQLIQDMEAYFSDLRIEKETKLEEANKENFEEVVSPKRKIEDEIDDDGFVLVVNKRKRTTRLKEQAGQR